MECVSCGLRVVNLPKPGENGAAWTSSGGTDMGERLPYCADSDLCRNDAEQQARDGAFYWDDAWSEQFEYDDEDPE